MDHHESCVFSCKGAVNVTDFTCAWDDSWWEHVLTATLIARVAAPASLGADAPPVQVQRTWTRPSLPMGRSTVQ